MRAREREDDRGGCQRDGRATSETERPLKRKKVRNSIRRTSMRKNPLGFNARTHLLVRNYYDAE